MPKPKITTCLRGHDTTKTGSRYADGACKACVAERDAKKYGTPKEVSRLLHIAERKKLSALTRYGPGETLGCCWEGCTVIDPDMLSIDHIDDSGAKHILPGTKKRLSGSRMYSWLKTQGYPEGFQTLCMNHQAKKHNLKNRLERRLGVKPGPQLEAALLAAGENFSEPARTAPGRPTLEELQAEEPHR
jgi:hypothetical protein